MTRNEFRKRYENHPLGQTIRQCESTTDVRNLHIYFIAAKTTIHLLKYQGELTAEDEESLVAMLYRITDGKLGTQGTAH